MASETKPLGLGEACCLYTVASVNTSVEVCTMSCILYHKEPFGNFFNINSRVHEHNNIIIHSYMYVHLLENIA